MKEKNNKNYQAFRSHFSHRETVHIDQSDTTHQQYAVSMEIEASVLTGKCWTRSRQCLETAASAPGL